MAPTPRRDPSYASNRLTKGNYNQPPLLSTVKGRPTRQSTVRQYRESSSSDSSDDPITTDVVHQPSAKGDKLRVEENPQKQKPEPATDDDPISSEDEAGGESSSNSQAGDNSLGLGGSEARRRKSRWSAKDLQSTLAKGDAEEEAQKRKDSERTPNSKPGKQGTPQTAVKRSTGPASRSNASFISPGTKRNRVTDTFTPYNSKRSDDEGRGLFGGPLAKKPRITQQYRGARNPRPAVNGHDNGAAAKTRLSSEAASDEPVHSSQVTGSATEFRDPDHFALDNIPDSSFPTEGSHPNENDLFDVDLDPDGSISPLSSVSSSISPLFTAKETSRLPPPARCPMCNELVGEEFSGEIQKLKARATTKVQMDFCRKHRIRQAEKDWVDRGYPTIIWEELEKRIERHFPTIDKILTLEIPSHYRNMLQKAAKEKHGNLRLTAADGLDDISSGYYGARGSKAMSDAIICQFTSNLQEASLADSLMQAVGVSGYVQSVLVPELTIMLVKEDMRVNDEEAREIVKQSTQIGDLLSEAPDDVITRRGRRRSLAN